MIPKHFINYSKEIKTLVYDWIYETATYNIMHVVKEKTCFLDFLQTMKNDGTDF